jgi:hypothetical protein
VQAQQQQLAPVEPAARRHVRLAKRKRERDELDPLDPQLRRRPAESSSE